MMIKVYLLKWDDILGDWYFHGVWDFLSDIPNSLLQHGYKVIEGTIIAEQDYEDDPIVWEPRAKQDYEDDWKDDPVAYRMRQANDDCDLNNENVSYTPPNRKDNND
jgi:hypothetical protein